MGKKHAVGRAPVDAGVALVDVLTPEDLGELEMPKEGPKQTLQRIRDSHHAPARYMAMGLRDQQIAAMTGYTLAYLSLLKGDPAFQELVQHYSNHEGEEFRDLQERMSLLAQDAMEEIGMRLRDEESAASISFPALVELASRLLDRTGHGPVQKSMQLVGTLSPAEMEEMKRAAQASEKITSVKEVGERGETDRAIEMGKVGSPSALSSSEKPEGSATGRTDLRAEGGQEAPEQAAPASGGSGEVD